MHGVDGNEVNEEPIPIGEYIVWSTRPLRPASMPGDIRLGSVRLVFHGVAFFLLMQCAVLSS